MTKGQAEAIGAVAFFVLWALLWKPLVQFFTPMVGAGNAGWATLAAILAVLYAGAYWLNEHGLL